MPLFYANLDVGHVATYFEENGGEFGRVAVGWLKWHLLSDETETGKLMFAGKDCGLCNSEWMIKKKMID